MADLTKYNGTEAIAHKIAVEVERLQKEVRDHARSRLIAAIEAEVVPKRQPVTSPTE